MLLVILGAGASYDSADPYAVDVGKREGVREWRPPLATELFAPRTAFGAVIDQLPDCRSLVVYLRKALDMSDRLLERELDVVSVRAETDPRAATQLMAVRYYLQYVIEGCSMEWFQATHGCTNYHYLVERLDQWARENNECVLYVTFNYDTLLERAIADSGPKLHIDDLADYITHPRLKLFKLHGSVDWGHTAISDPPYLIPDSPHASNAARDYVIEHATEVSIHPKIMLRRDQNSGTGGQVSVPALSVPIENKGDFECPQSHIEALEKLLPQADRLLIIGWRATEQHFLTMLSRTIPDPTRVLVTCAGKHESFSTWERINKAKSGLAVRGWYDWQNNMGFSDLVASQELEEILT